MSSSTDRALSRARTFWAGIGPVTAIAPGVFVDAGDNIHLDVRRILQHLGAEDSPENRRRIAQHLVRDHRQLGGGAS